MSLKRSSTAMEDYDSKMNPRYLQLPFKLVDGSHYKRWRTNLQDIFYCLLKRNVDLEAITSMELIDPEYFGLNDDSYLEPPVLSSQPLREAPVGRKDGRFAAKAATRVPAAIPVVADVPVGRVLRSRRRPAAAPAADAPEVTT